MKKLAVYGIIFTSFSLQLSAEPLKPIKNTLLLANAATICERLMTSLQAKHDFATEEKTRSNDSELAVTWPPNEGKEPVICTVNRLTRKITSIESNGSILLTGKEISDMDRDEEFREEIKLGNYKNFSKFAKESIANQFKDPGSVQFRGLFVSGRKMSVLCGEINGKNSYGAYVGFNRFYSTGKATLNSVESAQNKSVFESMWPSMCGDKISDVTESAKK